MTAPFDIEYFFTIVLPPIFKYCTQHPIANDRRKLSLATHQKEERITHVQLAWLQAVTEFDFQTFESINPARPDLLARIHKLQECFRIILQAEIAKNPEKNEIERKSILGEIDTNENAIYRIPLMLAVKLLNIVLNQEERNKITKTCNETDSTAESGNVSPTSQIFNHASKLSNHCNSETKDCYMAIEQVLKGHEGHDLKPKAIWNTLLTKEADKINYKIKSIQPCSQRTKSITFMSGHTINYHAAQASSYDKRTLSLKHISMYATVESNQIKSISYDLWPNRSSAFLQPIFFGLPIEETARGCRHSARRTE